MGAVHLITLNGCALTIGAYPPFHYNALGGGAHGNGTVNETSNQLQLVFPAESVQIPELSCRTARFLGLPLPPGLAITIAPQRLEGVLEPANGNLSLNFQAQFQLQFSIGSWMVLKAPGLSVNTTLTTSAISSSRHHKTGKPLNHEGTAVLVGTAIVEPSGAAWLDRFLGLPDEALAVLHCRLETHGT
jgi:hypothetical protein